MKSVILEIGIVSGPANTPGVGLLLDRDTGNKLDCTRCDWKRDTSTYLAAGLAWWEIKQLQGSEDKSEETEGERV